MKSKAYIFLKICADGSIMGESVVEWPLIEDKIRESAHISGRSEAYVWSPLHVRIWTIPPTATPEQQKHFFFACSDHLNDIRSIHAQDEPGCKIILARAGSKKCPVWVDLDGAKIIEKIPLTQRSNLDKFHLYNMCFKIK